MIVMIMIGVIIDIMIVAPRVNSWFFGIFRRIHTR